MVLWYMWKERYICPSSRMFTKGIYISIQQSIAVGGFIWFIINCYYYTSPYFQLSILIYLYCRCLYLDMFTIFGCCYDFATNTFCQSVGMLIWSTLLSNWVRLVWFILLNSLVFGETFCGFNILRIIMLWGLLVVPLQKLGWMCLLYGFKMSLFTVFITICVYIFWNI